MKTIVEQAQAAAQAAQRLRSETTERKNLFLETLMQELEQSVDMVLDANKQDIEQSDTITSAMKKRLGIDADAVKGFIETLRSIKDAEDPVGKITKTFSPDQGFTVNRVLAPIGVVAIIFESRPNVLLEAAALGVKSGNVMILRGGKEAMHTNQALFDLIQKSLTTAGIANDAVQLVEDRRHEAIDELIALDEYVDLVIPRGREALINRVVSGARMPVIQHMRGLCHMYIDESATADMAIKLIVNAKTSNPATCNTVETLLVHADMADAVLPEIIKQLIDKGVEVRGDATVCEYSDACVPATDEDWDTEYLDMIISIKVVDSFDAALDHIDQYSSGLTDSIVSNDKDHIQRFLDRVNSAVVLVNASNRLADGGVFGLGAEIGISTSSIHMKGPMALEDLTVSHYEVMGDGHAR